MLRMFGLIALLPLLTYCQTTTKDLPAGVSAAFSGYVPARIAVLPCRSWPDGAHFAERGLSNTTKDILERLCLRFDQFVLAGFKDQPYMRGFSPSSLEKMLSSSNQADLLGRMDREWVFAEDSCLDCKNAQSFYVSTIAKRLGWKKWLSTLSENARFADALLIPTVMTSFEKTYMDRGVRVHMRGAKISLILVDTSNGILLWSGDRMATADSQLFPDGTASNPPPPEWGLVEDRLFTEDVWREFPGRQVYR
jgi:hypothetical protein